MKAVITGATGCTGRHLAIRLKELGWQVTGLGRDTKIGQWLTKKGVKFMPCSLSEQDKLLDAFKEANCIFHCAALSSAWGAEKSFYETNVVGTKNVLIAAQKAAVQRLIFLSSPSIYFDYSDRYMISENDPLPPKAVNHYAQSKRDAEQLVAEATAEGLSCVTLRPRGIIAPFDTALVPRLVRVAKKGILPLFRGGDALVDVTCIENLIEAMISAAVTQNDVSGKFYNISNGKPVTVKDLLLKVSNHLNLNAKLTPLPFAPSLFLTRAIASFASGFMPKWEPPVTPYSLSLLAYGQTLDLSEAIKDLSYDPKVSLEDGLEKLAIWWRQKP
jgi:nucleoside-diphosphate-sugar epimerase